MTVEQPTLEPGELDLPFLPIEDAAFSLDPVRHFVEARKRHPWLAQIGVGYMLTQHSAMREIMRNDASMVIGFNELVEYMGATGTPWGNFIRGSVQTQTGDTHIRLRNALRAAFSPRMANRYRQVMREQVNLLLDDWLPRGQFDFEEFASYYPISVMCRMIGVPTGVIPEIRASLEALGLAMSMDRRFLPELQRSTLQLEDVARSVVAERRAGRRLSEEEDLLDMVIAAQDRGEMTDEELHNLIVFMFVGGYDTSKNVITLIMFPWGMSGRDESAVDDPHTFDPERSGVASSHFGFGMGSHVCLGQFIGKAQVEEGFHVIAQRLRNPRLTGQPGWRPFPGVWGVAGLPIAFDRD